MVVKETRLYLSIVPIMDAKFLADSSFIADSKLVKENDVYYLVDDDQKIDLTEILNLMCGKEVRLTIISRDTLLDIEKAVVNR